MSPCGVRRRDLPGQAGSSRLQRRSSCRTCCLRNLVTPASPSWSPWNSGGKLLPHCLTTEGHGDPQPKKNPSDKHLIKLCLIKHSNTAMLIQRSYMPPSGHKCTSTIEYEFNSKNKPTETSTHFQIQLYWSHYWIFWPARAGKKVQRQKHDSQDRLRLLNYKF